MDIPGWCYNSIVCTIEWCYLYGILSGDVSMNKRVEAVNGECIARMFKELRLKKNLTQQDVADAAGLHHTYISNIECGKRTAKKETMTHLVSTLTQMDVIPVIEVIKWEELDKTIYPRKKFQPRRPEVIPFLKEISYVI